MNVICNIEATYTFLILESNPAPKTSEKVNGATGDGRTRGEKGYGPDRQGGKQQWDPGSKQKELDKIKTWPVASLKDPT